MLIKAIRALWIDVNQLACYKMRVLEFSICFRPLPQPCRSSVLFPKTQRRNQPKVMTDPLPNLRLAPQEKPNQKISVNRMPTSVYTLLAERAGKLNRKVSSYCRIVIEHALANRKDYEGPLTQGYTDNPCHNEAIHIPIQSKKIMDELFAWDPFGVGRRTEIAMSLLKKHLEVRNW